MKILPISYKNNTYNHFNITNNNNIRNIQTRNTTILPSFTGTEKILTPIEEIKLEADKFPKDAEYRKTLMINAGLDPNDYFKLRPIIGGEEIKKIMNSYNEVPQVYSVGNNDYNIKNNLMRANLHIHTTASDGFLTVQDLLDSAAVYADETAKKYPYAKQEPFTIAITDHDTTESAKKAIKIIANDPLKYRNLRVILGVEMTTYNDIATDIVNQPTNTHVLAYGIDPNEKVFNSFINNTKNQKQAIEQKMIKEANNTYKNFYNADNFFNIDEAQKNYAPLKKGILGIYNYMTKHLETKSMVENVILKDQKIKNILNEKNLPQNTDDFMNGLEEYFYTIDHNNKARSPEKAITEYLAAKTEKPIEEINQIISTSAETTKFKAFKNELNNNLEQFKRTFKPSEYNYLPKFENLYNSLEKQDGAIIGLAHPLDTVSKIEDHNDKYKFLSNLYEEFVRFTREKAKFSEVYYQSYTGATQDFDLYKFTNRFLDILSEKYELFKTGSADTHRLNIFKRF